MALLLGQQKQTVYLTKATATAWFEVTFKTLHSRFITTLENSIANNAAVNAFSEVSDDTATQIAQDTNTAEICNKIIWFMNLINNSQNPIEEMNELSRNALIELTEREGNTEEIEKAAQKFDKLYEEIPISIDADGEITDLTEFTREFIEHLAMSFLRKLDNPFADFAELSTQRKILSCAIDQTMGIVKECLVSIKEDITCNSRQEGKLGRPLLH